jgi:hypothetical protein
MNLPLGARVEFFAKSLYDTELAGERLVMRLRTAVDLASEFGAYSTHRESLTLSIWRSLLVLRCD